MGPREHTVSILASAMFWMLLEGVLHILCRGWLYAALYPCGVPLHGKGRREASANVTSGVVKLVSTVFNSIQVPVALAVLAQPEVRSDTIYGHSSLSVGMCIIAAGYFLYDLVVVLLRFEREGGAFLVHACCCLFAYMYATYSYFLTFYGAAFLLWEISTPFVHMRWFLLKSGREASTAYLVNGLTMAATFFACRPLWGTYISYKFWMDTEAELSAPRPDGFPASGIWGYRIANLALNSLNYWWFSKIATKVAQAVFKPSRARKGSKAR